MKALIALLAVVVSLSVASSSFGKDREDVRKTVACSDVSMAKLKLSDEDGRIRLQPENSALEPLYPDHVQILGKVVGLFRRL